MKPTRNAFLASPLAHRRVSFAATFVISLCASHFASAASATWNAVAVDSNWPNVTGLNWTSAVPGATAPGSNNTTNADVATFNAVSNFSSVAIDNTRFIKSIVFDSTAGAYTFTGGLLYLFNAGSITMNAAVTNPQLFSNTWQARQLSSNNGVYSFVNNSSTSTATMTFNASAITLTSANGRPTTLTLDGSNTGDNTISSNLTDAGGTQGVNIITKQGAGTWILSGANTFTGSAATNVGNGIQINGGTLVASNNAALGTNATANTNQVSVNNTGILRLSNGITLDDGLTLNLNTGGTITSNGSNITNARIKVSATASTSVTISTVGASDVFTVGNAANDFTGGLSADTVTHFAGPGTVLLGQASNYQGFVSVDAGTLKLGNATALGTAGVTFGASSTGKLQLDGNSVSIGSLNSSGAVGTIENNNANAAILTVGNVSDVSAYGGALQNGAAAGNLALIKVGASSLTLSGNSNAYTGGTTISAGTLLATNTSGSATGTGTVAVNGGILGGTGFVTGAVSVASAAGIAPGNGGVGTLTVGPTTLDSGSNLDYDITSTSTLDKITVNGALTINGGQLNINGGAAAFTTNGVYNLIGGFGSISGTGVSALSVNSLNKDITKTYTFGQSGGFVTLTVANSGAAVSYWNTNANGNW
ncbi:MAG: autotransporter-associated beta strand repeat-containing protein, partial [Luteolibacter sp.]